jgi:transposase-like protein
MDCEGKEMANIKQPRSLQEAIAYFADPERAFVYAVNLRWPGKVITCPRCGCERHSFLRTRLMWFCKGCKKQFSVKVGTIFEDSPLGMDKWMTAFWMVCNCKNGVSSAEMARTLKITQKSAWFMLHRVREVIKNNSVEKLGSTGGAVESDETFIGPKPQRMHKDRRIKLEQLRGQQRRGDMYVGKTAVHGMLDRDTREIRCKVVPNIKRETLQNEILNNIQYGSRIYTDEAPVYHDLGKSEAFIHEVVNHTREYVRGQVTTNGLENFWSLFKRNLRGTYVSVEPFHLDRYLDEQVFRFNNRGGKKPEQRVTDAQRFEKAMSMTSGKRLTYAQLTGKGVDSLHHQTAAQGQEEPF